MENQEKVQAENPEKYLIDIRDGCTSCGLCRKECGFLQARGLPGEIAGSYDPLTDYRLAFECSLCGLCTEVCPVSLDPGRMFLEMRKDSFSCGRGDFKEHRAIRNYEKVGISPLFNHYRLPPDCRTVFFPGCALPGTRPERVIQVYHHLKQEISALGIVLDCCIKPSHDLGDHDFFSARFNKLKSRLLAAGVREVLVACPNCFKVFSSYGGDLKVTTVYEKLLGLGLPRKEKVRGAVVLHDPCSVRFNEGLQKAVRKIVSQTGLQVQEMEHNRCRTICCGEGGAAGLINKGRAADWLEQRRLEAGGRPLITYCAGCANFLGKEMAAFHLLDLVFAPRQTMIGAIRAARFPFTYLNRLKLKRYFRKENKSAGRAGGRESTEP